MPVNLTKVKSRLNNIKTNLYYGKTTPTMKLWNVNELLLEMTKDFFMPTRIATNQITGAEYWNLYIADTTGTLDLEPILMLTTQIEIAGERYTISGYTRPRGLTKQWNLRLISTGERVTT